MNLEMALKTTISKKMRHTLSSATSSTGVSSHGNSLLVLLDVFKELNGTLELPAIDGLCGLTSVLERHTEIGTTGASRLRRVDFGGSVSNLYGKQGQRGPESHSHPAHHSIHPSHYPDSISFIRLADRLLNMEMNATYRSSEHRSLVKNGICLPSCRRLAMGRYWWLLDSRRLNLRKSVLEFREFVRSAKVSDYGLRP